jgi:hypothetical protein
LAAAIGKFFKKTWRVRLPVFGLRVQGSWNEQQPDKNQRKPKPKRKKDLAMKTTFKTLFATIAATFSLVASVSAQQFNYSGYYQPSNTPWENNYPMHQTANDWGHAQGGGELQVFELRDGVYVMNGDNAYGAGVMGEANLFRGTVSGTAGTHSVMDGDRVLVFNEANGQLEWKVGARGYAESGIYYGEDAGMRVHAGVQAGQSVNADGDFRTRLIGLGFGGQGSAEAGVGVETGAGIQSGTDGTSIGAGAFAGDYARAEGTVDIGGLGVGGSVEGWAGVGAEIKSEASFEDGVLKIKPTIGLALGVGGKLSPEIEIDTNKIQEEFTDFGNNVAHYGGQAVDAIEKEVPKAFEEVGQATVDAADVVAQGTVDTANVVAEGTVDTYNTVANEVTNAANVVADGTVDAANTVAQGTVDAANVVAQGTVDTFNTIGQGTVDAANTVAQGTVDAANTVGQGFVDAGNAVGNFFKSWW